MSRLPTVQDPIGVVEPLSLYDSKQDQKQIENLDFDSHLEQPTFISSISKDEPIVTRRELWSYYRE